MPGDDELREAVVRVLAAALGCALDPDRTEPCGCCEQDAPVALDALLASPEVLALFVRAACEPLAYESPVGPAWRNVWCAKPEVAAVLAGEAGP